VYAANDTVVKRRKTRVKEINGASESARVRCRNVVMLWLYSDEKPMFDLTEERTMKGNDCDLTLLLIEVFGTNLHQ